MEVIKKIVLLAASLCCMTQVYAGPPCDRQCVSDMIQGANIRGMARDGGTIARAATATRPGLIIENQTTTGLSWLTNALATEVWPVFDNGFASSTILNGFSDPTNVIAGLIGDAIPRCHDLSTGGFHDWFMPSLTEIASASGIDRIVVGNPGGIPNTGFLPIGDMDLMTSTHDFGTPGNALAATFVGGVHGGVTPSIVLNAAGAVGRGVRCARHYYINIYPNHRTPRSQK